MKQFTILASVLLFVCCLAPLIRAQDQVVTIEGELKELKRWNTWITPDGEIQGKEEATKRKNAFKLIRETLLSQPEDTSTVEGKNFYCVVHVVKWKDNTTKGPAIVSQRWFLLHVKWDQKGKSHALDKKWTKKRFEGTRIFGSKVVAVLFVHLNASSEWGMQYKVEVNKKQPAPVENLLALLGVLAPQPKLIALPSAWWGGRVLEIDYVPSKITVHAQLESPKRGEFGAKNYLNEGRYYWDVSVGIPLKKVNELEFGAEDGTVRVKKIDRQKLFAFVNVFYPKKVDTEGWHRRWPHAIVGVALSNRPLDRIFTGIGVGWNKVQFFAGAVYNKVDSPQTLPEGQMGVTQPQLEADLRGRYVTKFMWGINLPVRQVLKAVQGTQ